MYISQAVYMSEMTVSLNLHTGQSGCIHNVYVYKSRKVSMRGVKEWKKKVEIIETSWALAIKIHAHEQLYFSTEVYWNLELNLSGIDLQNSILLIKLWPHQHI